MMRKKIVAGNWKMNLGLPEGEALITAILSQLKDVPLKAEVIVAPSFITLPLAAVLTKGSVIKIAAQNCSSESQGAFTGEVSAAMIKSAGAEYVIIGLRTEEYLQGK